MKQFKFDKPFVESATAPKDTNVYWIDVHEPSGIPITISEFVTTSEGTGWTVKWIVNITDLAEAGHWVENTEGDPEYKEVTVPLFSFDGSLIKDFETTFTNLSQLDEKYYTAVGHLSSQTEVLDNQVEALTDVIEELDPDTQSTIIASLTDIKTNVNSASTILKTDIPTNPIL